MSIDAHKMQQADISKYSAQSANERKVLTMRERDKTMQIGKKQEYMYLLSYSAGSGFTTAGVIVEKISVRNSTSGVSPSVGQSAGAVSGPSGGGGGGGRGRCCRALAAAAA